MGQGQTNQRSRCVVGVQDDVIEGDAYEDEDDDDDDDIDDNENNGNHH